MVGPGGTGVNQQEHNNAYTHHAKQLYKQQFMEYFDRRVSVVVENQYLAVNQTLTPRARN